MVQLYFGIPFNERNIKGLPVVSDDDLVFLNITDKIFQVSSLNIIFDRGSVIQGNGGDVKPPMIQTGGLDIQISGGGSEFWEDTPVTVRRQQI